MAARFSSKAARVSLALAAGLLVAATSSLPASATAGFGAGDLVIYRVGTGTGTLSSAATAVFLDDYTTGGSLVNSVALPTADAAPNLAVTASGSATSEGLLSLTGDGHSLLATGYDDPVGTAGVATSTVARAVAVVSSTGAIDSSTAITTTLNGNNIRSAYAVSGTGGSNLWVGSPSGPVFTKVDTSGPATAINTQNTRSVQIYNNQLYISSSSGSFRLATVGSGTPTAAATNAELPGITTTQSASPYEYLFESLGGTTNPDTLYVADNTDGIQKYSFAAGTWTLNGTATIPGEALTGLTGSVTNGVATLYATNPGGLYMLADAAGSGALTGTPTQLATAGTNEAFRGVAFAPTADAGTQVPESPLPVLLPLTAIALLLGGFLVTRRRRAPANKRAE